MKSDQGRDSINSLLDQLQRRTFFGSIELKFERGRVVLIRQVETIKPPPETHRDNRGGEDERS